MATAYIEDSYPYTIRDEKDDSELAVCAYISEIMEWFQNNRHKYIMVEKHG